MSESKLNELFYKHFSGDLTGLKPVEFYKAAKTAVTIPPHNVDAYNLVSPVAGTMKTFENSNLNPTIGIFRSILGYTLACKMLHNENLFIYQICLMINDSLLQLTQELGNLDNREITCTRPGSNSGPFRDIDNYAGFEFRVLVQEKK